MPLALYFADGKVKIELALARGKQAHDKRQDMAAVTRSVRSAAKWAVAPWACPDTCRARLLLAAAGTASTISSAVLPLGGWRRLRVVACPNPVALVLLTAAGP